tara:strand:+ start:699 stop:890 length:192 start_codon:yes stop_codon:yes gene_type:complete
MNKNYYFENLDKFDKKFTIITQQGRNISYNGLLKYIGKLDSIISKRDIVFLISDNNSEFIFSY